MFTSRSQTFTYDALNWLTSAQNTGTDCTVKVLLNVTEYWGNSYGYDAWGNLLNKSVTKCSAENFSVAALASNQLSGYNYDAAGNMTHDLTSGLTYTFDPENRITGTNGYTYTYDADGNRVKKSNGTTGTLYCYMTPGIVSESDLAGNLKSEYIFFNGKRLVRVDQPSNAYYYYLSDHLNSTSMVVSSSGIPEEESDYSPFGAEYVITGAGVNRYKFTGKERDAESGLDYFGARFNAASMGRFMTPDWSAKPQGVPYAVLGDPQSLNLYAYVGNNPLNRIDPDGHYDDKCARGDKKCEKGVKKFDKQVGKDLKSKDPKVRAAAAAWGTPGDHNGVGVKFVTQQQMDADAHTAPGFKTDAMVTPGVTANHKLTVDAEFSENLSGSTLGQPVAHEGSHIEDDANFVNSFNPATGKYFSGANFTHFDTEFQAFEAGSDVKAYPMFQRGPNGYQKLEDYINRAYPNANDLVFPPAVFPQ